MVRVHLGPLSFAHKYKMFFGALAQLGERLPCTQEVSGSIPLGSTFYKISSLLPYYYGGVAQLARASGSYPGGRGFDPLRRYYYFLKILDL